MPNPLIVLAIDTALNACSAAVAADGVVLAARTEAMTRGQAERLAPLVAEVMAEAGMGFTALNRIIVTAGPGSFTGVRVGLAFARTLAMALGLPCVGVSTLEALALSEGVGGLRAACIVTPGALYLGAWRDGVVALEPRAADLAEARALLAGLEGGALYGPGALALAEAGGALVGHALASPDLRALALRLAHVDPAAYPADPTYLRPPGATPPL